MSLKGRILKPSTSRFNSFQICDQQDAAAANCTLSQGSYERVPHVSASGPLRFFNHSVLYKESEDRRPSYRRNVNLKPNGIHDYYNLMWDPHVYRGSSTITFETAEKQLSAQISKEKTKKSSKKVFNWNRKLGGLGEFSIKEKPIVPFDNSAWDRFLVEAEQPKYDSKDESTETDSTFEFDKEFEANKTFGKPGKDFETQISVDESYSFTEVVKPIIATLTDNILDQALLEIIEDEELRRFCKHENEFLQREKFTLRQHKVLEEQKRKKLVMLERESQKRDKQIQEEEELEQRIGAWCFATTYNRGMVAIILENLRDSGYTNDATQAVIEDQFIPWLNNSVEEKIKLDRLLPRDIVNDIVKNVAIQQALKFKHLPDPNTINNNRANDSMSNITKEKSTTITQTQQVEKAAPPIRKDMQSVSMQVGDGLIPL